MNSVRIIYLLFQILNQNLYKLKNFPKKKVVEGPGIFSGVLIFLIEGGEI